MFFDKFYSQPSKARTFQKALNGYLAEEWKISQLFQDLRDGRRLLQIIKQFCDVKNLVSFMKKF